MSFIIDRHLRCLIDGECVTLPVETDDEFLLEIWADRRTRKMYVWVDGKLVDERRYETGGIEAERFSECYFGGAWHPTISGVVRLREISAGGLKPLF